MILWSSFNNTIKKKKKQNKLKKTVKILQKVTVIQTVILTKIGRFLIKFLIFVVLIEDFL